MKKLTKTLKLGVMTMGAFLLLAQPTLAAGGSPYSPYNPYNPHPPIDTSFGGQAMLIIAAVFLYVIGTIFIIFSKSLKSKVN